MKYNKVMTHEVQHHSGLIVLKKNTASLGAFLSSVFLKPMKMIENVQYLPD